jgi:hypothetical protein
MLFYLFFMKIIDSCYIIWNYLIQSKTGYEHSFVSVLLSNSQKTLSW